MVYTWDTPSPGEMLMPRLIHIAVLAALILVTTLSAGAQADDLARIQESIASQGLPWTAGDNPQWRLDPAVRTARNGSPAPTHWAGPIMSRDRDYPMLLDWRDNDGNWVTRVRNQGGCGSCWIFSAVAATESWFMLHSGAPIPGLNFSEQYLLSCGSGGSCNGG